MPLADKKSSTEVSDPIGTSVFAAELLATCWEDAKALTTLHHSEVSVIEADHFSPDLSKYVALENAGILRIFTLRVDGKLVGYNIFVVFGNPHYGEMGPWATQDVLFVHPDHRGILAAHFVRWTDRVLLELEHVAAVHRHVTLKVNYAPLLEADGYELIERGYIKRPKPCV